MCARILVAVLAVVLLTGCGAGAHSPTGVGARSPTGSPALNCETTQCPPKDEHGAATIDIGGSNMSVNRILYPTPGGSVAVGGLTWTLQEAGYCDVLDYKGNYVLYANVVASNNGAGEVDTSSFDAVLNSPNQTDYSDASDVAQSAQFPVLDSTIEPGGTSSGSFAFVVPSTVISGGDLQGWAVTLYDENSEDIGVLFIKHTGDSCPAGGGN
jgi:hypothetical protein